MMSKGLQRLAFITFGFMTLVGLFNFASMHLGSSVESLVSTEGETVAVYEYGPEAWSVAAGISSLLGFALLAVAGYAAMTGKFSVVRVMLLLGLVASIPAGPIVVLALLFAVMAMIIVRDRQRPA